MKKTILNSWQETQSLIMQMQIDGVGNEIYKTEVLKSNLWDYNDAYILLRDDITIIKLEFFKLQLL